MECLQLHYAKWALAPPMEGALGAGEALQHVLKVAAEDLDVVKVRARVEQQDTDPDKRGNFIVGDGCVHIF